MRYLVAVGMLFWAVIAGAVYILPDTPNEPGPTPRLVLVFGYWSESASGCFTTGGSSCGGGGPVWNVEYEAFGSVAGVGEWLVSRSPSWPNREILGLWELGESSRIPIKQSHTVKTVPERIEIKEHKLVIDHFKVGNEEFQSDPRQDWN